MIKHYFTLIATIFFLTGILKTAGAQNKSPFWSLSGNSNAGDSSKLGTTNSIPLRMFTKNKERLRIDALGRVGIGTKNPSYKLHVEGGSSFAAVYGNDSLGYGVYGTGGAYGVYGNGHDGVFGWSNDSHYGVYGLSNKDYADTNSVGVYGDGFIGVEGVGPFGVSGEGEFGVSGKGSLYGVYAISTSIGVWGEADSIGVLAGGGRYGIWATYFDNPGAYAGYFNGNVFATGVYTASDSSLKKNIADFSNAIDIINKLQPKTYEFRQDGNYKLIHLPAGKHYGLIAQNVEKVLPGLVKTSEFDPGLTQSPTMPGSKPAENISKQKQAEVINFEAVNYTELIPILVKAMQEQDEKIKVKDEKIADMERRLTHLELTIANNSSTSSYLEQNTPDPAGSITIIRYNIAETFNSASIIITNAQGQLIKTIAVNRGVGQISLNTSLLSTGIYSYILYINGKQADSKRLLITH